MAEDYCSLPANSVDIEGIYKYLSWRLIKNGEPSYAQGWWKLAEKIMQSIGWI